MFRFLMANKQNVMVVVYLILILLGIILLKCMGWENFWSWLHVQTMSPCFADMRTVQSGLISFASGINPQLINSADPWGRTMNYPLVWLDIARGYALTDETNFLFFCSAMILAFFLFCGFLLYRFPSGFLLVSIFSSSTLLAIERGNNDLLVFLLLVIFAYRRSILSSAAFCFAAMSKVYPVFALHALLVKGAYRRLVFLSAISLCILIFLYPQLSSLTSGNTATGLLSYGTNTFAKIIGKRAALKMGALGIPALGWSVYIILVWATIKSTLLKPFWSTLKQEGLEVRLFLTGGAIYIYTFIFATNYDYRLIFLILCVPLLVRPTHGWQGKVVAGLVLLAMNAQIFHKISTVSKALLFVVLSVLIWRPMIDTGKIFIERLLIQMRSGRRKEPAL